MFTLCSIALNRDKLLCVYKTYIVRDINGIKVGMTCYTYCSGYTSAKNYIIDGVYLPTEATVRTNAFHYKDLNTFYMKLAGELQEMNTDGLEKSAESSYNESMRSGYSPTNAGHCLQ